MFRSQTADKHTAHDVYQSFCHLLTPSTTDYSYMSYMNIMLGIFHCLGCIGYTHYVYWIRFKPGDGNVFSFQNTVYITDILENGQCLT